MTTPLSIIINCIILATARRSSTPSDMSLDAQLRRLFPDLPQNLQHLVKTKRILVSYWENPRWYGTIAFALSYRG
jgi:hypothetical protein